MKESIYKLCQKIENYFKKKQFEHLFKSNSSNIL